MQDSTQSLDAETIADATEAEGTTERIETNEAIVSANTEGFKADIKAVKEYFAEGSAHGEPSLQELKAVMGKRADGTSDMDDLKAALSIAPGATEPTYTY